MAASEWLVDEGLAPRTQWVNQSHDHPIRVALQRVTSGECQWQALVSHYDEQALDWETWTRSTPTYFEAVRRGLALVDIGFPSLVLEVCSGSAPVPRELLDGSSHVCLDASDEMLRAMSPVETRVCANVESLPFADGTFACVLSVNGYVDVLECVRVLSENGVLIVAWTFGSWTPMYRSWDEILRDLPDGCQLDLGRGTWGEFGVVRLNCGR